MTVQNECLMFSKMSVIVRVFLWVCVLQFVCCADPEQSSKGPTSGPFRISIASIKDCTNPSKPYVKNPPVIFLPSTHNSTLSGNMTFVRNTKNMKIKLRGFILRDGKWDPAYLINNLDCHGMVLHLMCVTMNIKYDRKSCMYFKGSYSFENLDVNALLHLWISSVQYGHILWRSETYTQAGTFDCKEFDTMTEPA